LNCGTNAAGCWDGSYAFTVGNPVGVNNAGLFTSCRVYPFPVADRLFLEFSVDRDTELLATLYNLGGQLLQQVELRLTPGRSTESLDLSRLGPGGYLLKLQSGSGYVTELIVKQ
jgi:hypothetical protein